MATKTKTQTIIKPVEEGRAVKDETSEADTLEKSHQQAAKEAADKEAAAEAAVHTG